MPVYDFRFGDVPAGNVHPNPINQPDITHQPTQFEDPTNKVIPEDVKSILTPGFMTMDRGIIHYFSDLTVPQREGLKKVDIRLAGGDRTILIWKQDLSSGRIKLPVISVNRTSVNRNEAKFSPPYVPVYQKFADRDGTRMLVMYREWPCLIDYQLSIWAESKHDLEHIIYQIITRFHPLAEWGVDDANMSGLVQAKYNGLTYNTDIDMDADGQPYKRADINIVAEGWLPLPTYKTLPTVLGKVGVLSETTGTVLETIITEPGNQ